VSTFLFLNTRSAQTLAPSHTKAPWQSNARSARILTLMVERFNYRNSIQGLARMTREEGISSWARGIAPNTVRAILMNMSQLAR
jgi:hypothetical protein